MDREMETLEHLGTWLTVKPPANVHNLVTYETGLLGKKVNYWSDLLETH
jgi:hypothetical protein